MPASEAQIKANRENSKKSSGPKTPEGKEASRGNALKHGLTATKVLPEMEAEEVKRRYLSFCQELNPSGEVGYGLVLRLATLSARMQRCVSYETAMLNRRVRQAEADFVPPEGVDDATAAKLREEAGHRALFDPSKEAGLARKYEAAAERGYFRCFKELRILEGDLAKARDHEIDAELASFSEDDVADAMTDEEFDKLWSDSGPKSSRKSTSMGFSVDRVDLNDLNEVPFAIGKPG